MVGQWRKPCREQTHWIVQKLFEDWYHCLERKPCPALSDMYMLHRLWNRPQLVIVYFLEFKLSALKKSLHYWLVVKAVTWRPSQSITMSCPLWKKKLQKTESDCPRLAWLDDSSVMIKGFLPSRPAQHRFLLAPRSAEYVITRHDHSRVGRSTAALAGQRRPWATLADPAVIQSDKVAPIAVWPLVQLLELEHGIPVAMVRGTVTPVNVPSACRQKQNTAHRLAFW